jgi:nicotinamide mononucleotide (NMN) deamidase PncC
VAGPATQGDKPVGELYIAISNLGSTKVFAHQLSGDRAEIQKSAVLLGVGHLWEEITG